MTPAKSHSLTHIARALSALGLICICQTAFAVAAAPDSAAVSNDSITLGEVTVRARRPFSEIIPGQTLGGERLEAMRSHNVADALRYFSGVQIKDYGGVGGVKTVDIRSMGTNHTGIFYDGIQLGNAQNGQIDLGKFSLDNLEVFLKACREVSEVSIGHALTAEALQFGFAETVRRYEEILDRVAASED